MGKVIIEFTTSLDGFINDQNGSVERNPSADLVFGTDAGTIREQ